MDTQMSQTGSYRDLISVLLEIEQDLRTELEHTFTTPEPQEAMLFVVSEIGEVADAIVHSDKFARNDQHKVRNFEAELAQVLFMSLTVLRGLQDYELTESQVQQLNDIIFLTKIELNQLYWMGFVKDVIDLIYSHGLDPVELIQNESDKLRRKFGNTNSDGVL